MSKVIIYHNPMCSASRNTLALIRQTGIEPDVVLYLENLPARDTLRKMIATAGLTVREALRDKETQFKALGLDDASLTDAQLLDAIEAHPILLNRPFVVSDKGTRLCRPYEVVLEILPQA